jgi:tetratricopeptide (TPR) repeat protein
VKYHFLAALWIVFFSLPITNQPEPIEANKDLTILIEVENDLDRDAEPIIEALENELATSGVNLVPVERGPNVMMNIRIWEYENAKNIDISPWVSPVRDLSPILAVTSAAISRIILTDENFDHDQQMAVTLASAIGLYSLGLCEHATAKFAQLTQEAVSEIQSSWSYTLASIYFYLGNCSILDGNLNDAIPFLEKGLIYESQPTPNKSLVSSPINLAWVYIQVGNEALAFDLMNLQVDYAQSVFNQGGRLHYVGTLSQRAQIYALAERFDDAITDLNKALELTTYSPPLYIQRGEIYLLLYEWDKALSDYNAAIEEAPWYADAYYERGVLYYSILQTGVELRTDALADFQKYLELAPDGEKAADAARYVEQIQTELEALNG